MIPMIYKGIVRGATIELEEPLPYHEGQPVRVAVEPLEEQAVRGSALLIRQVMHSPPHLRDEDVAALERAIEKDKLPVRHQGVFDLEDGT